MSCSMDNESETFQLYFCMYIRLFLALSRIKGCQFRLDKNHTWYLNSWTELPQQHSLVIAWRQRKIFLIKYNPCSSSPHSLASHILPSISYTRVFSIGRRNCVMRHDVLLYTKRANHENILASLCEIRQVPKRALCLSRSPWLQHSPLRFQLIANQGNKTAHTAVMGER